MKKLLLGTLMASTLATGAFAGCGDLKKDGNETLISIFCHVGDALEEPAVAVKDVFTFGWVKGIFR